METAVGSTPGAARARRRQGWGALLHVLWAPRRTLTAALDGGWAIHPYVLGMVSSLVVWYLAVQLIPELGKPEAAAGPGGPEGGPGMAWGPMGPGPQPLPLDQLRAALRPEFLAVAALVAPWVGGLWRAALVHVFSALAGVRQPFSRSFGLAGYAMVPLWLGQVLAAVLAAALLATQPAPPAGAGAGPAPAGAEMAVPVPAGKMAVVVRSGGRGGPMGPGMPGGPMGPGMPGDPFGPAAGGGSSRPSFSQVPASWTLDRLAPDLKPGLWKRVLAGLDFFHLWHLLILGLGLSVLTRRWRTALWAAGSVLGSWLLLAALQPRMLQILTWIGLLR